MKVLPCTLYTILQVILVGLKFGDLEAKKYANNLPILILADAKWCALSQYFTVYFGDFKQTAQIGQN